MGEVIKAAGPAGAGSPALRFDRAEAGGALGDLGTFIPLLVGMVNRCGLQLGPALFCAGLTNVITGLTFGIPMPVQPMKAIAAVAIAEGLTEPQIVAAGIITGAVLLVLAVSGLVDWLNRAIPRSVVRGLQLALGLKLAASGLAMIAATHRVIGWDSMGVGLACAIVILLLYSSRRMPGVLVVFAIGLIALAVARPESLSMSRFGLAWRLPVLSNRGDWLAGLWRGALPQIPLTLLNSVIAVCALSVDLFPKRPAAPRTIARSVALMNLVFCPLGAMPMCYGAGGLAAQYRFGARTGGSVVILGAAGMALAALFGGSLLDAMRSYPQSVLGVLLFFGSLELILVCRDQRSRVDLAAMLVTAGACLATTTAAGFAIGWAIALVAQRVARRSGVVRPS